MGQHLVKREYDGVKTPKDVAVEKHLAACCLAGNVTNPILGRPRTVMATRRICHERGTAFNFRLWLPISTELGLLVRRTTRRNLMVNRSWRHSSGLISSF